MNAHYQVEISKANKCHMGTSSCFLYETRLSLQFFCSSSLKVFLGSRNQHRERWLCPAELFKDQGLGTGEMERGRRRLRETREKQKGETEKG